MKIVECVWKEQFIEKVEQKHAVSTEEVEEIFRNAYRYDFIAKGVVKGENVYRLLGQTTPDGIWRYFSLASAVVRLLREVRRAARRRGVATETLVNLWLQEKVSADTKSA